MNKLIPALSAVGLLAAACADASAQHLRPGLPNAPKLHPEIQVNSSPPYSPRPTVVSQPVFLVPLPVVTYYPPISPSDRYPVHNRYENDLARRVERAIERRYGLYVDDVDVDIDFRLGLASVKVEVRNTLPVRNSEGYMLLVRDLEAYIYSLPELRGLRVALRVERG